MSRRAEIRLTDEELRRYLDEQRLLTLATIGPAGRPHLAPLWYVPRTTEPAIELLAWTYARSQKVLNLRRRPEASLLVESGADYAELRGVSMEADVAIVEDAEAVAEIGLAVARRYSPEGVELPAEAIDAVRGQAAKRVGLVFTPTASTSWDHSKLGGGY